VTSLRGGLYDALKDTDGDMFAVSNDEVHAAQAMVLDLEGIDIYSAAAVSVASLIQAVNNRQVRPDDVIMLNITGGGELHFKSQHDHFDLKPLHVFPIGFTKEDVAAVMQKMAW